MKSYFLCSFFILSLLRGEWIPEPAWAGNKSILKKSLLGSQEIKSETPVYSDPLSFAFYQALKFYQNRLYQAPADGSKPGRCPFYPSCSRFALQALGAHGPVWGSLMTADRLFIREHQDLRRHYEGVELDGDTRFADPVEINFIFRKRDPPQSLF